MHAMKCGLLLQMSCRDIVCVCLTPVSPTCTKTDKSIVMPFGKQTRVGPRNPVLHGVHVGVVAGRLKTQVRKTKVPEDGICKYGKRKYESATVENVSIAT